VDPALLGLALFGPAAAVGLTLAWSRQTRKRLARELATLRTEHGAALARQHSQNELFRTLFEAAPECVKLQRADGRVERINAAGLALLETTQPSHVLGLPVYHWIADEYHAAYRELTRRVFAGGSGSMEFELLTFCGRRRWLETHAVPLRDDHGAVTALLAITRDIDERKRMTLQLEEQRTRLETIIESEPECVKLQDREGRIIEMNPAGLGLLCAQSAAQVIGSPIYDFLCEEYHEAYRQLTAQVFAGERRSLQFEVTTLDGRRRWLETHAAPLRDGDGEITALLAITRDIDEHRQAEEKLRRQRNELAHVSRLSTMGELASGLAHELKQPLCAVSSYAESAMLLNARPYGRNPQELERILHKIVRETERANDIIERLREFVRKQTPRLQAHDLGALLEEVLDIVEPELRRRSMRTRVTTQQAPGEVLVDRVQTEQILLNLLYNAMQASSRCEPRSQTIAIELGRLGHWASLVVRDFADGVPEGLRAKLFTPFFTTRVDGIGLGLSLSRSIAEAHGGQLTYEPAQPGSVFRLTLPRYAEAR
jgi:PAS domain S-box-containing protein